MNFNFGKEKPLSADVMQSARLKALAAADEMHAAYENLSDACKQLDEVHAVVENLDQAVGMVRTFGLTDQTKSILNFDGGLETLVGSVENLNANAALEAMEEQKSGAWVAFKEGCKKVIEAIKNFFRMIGEKFMELFRKTEVYKKAAEEGKKEGEAMYNSTFVKTVIPKDMYAILPGVIDGELANMNKLMADLAKYTECMVTGNYTGEMFDILEKLNNTKIFDDLENGKFFLKSHGEPVDTWEHIGYTTPNAVFTEIEKLHAFVTMLKPIFSIVEKLDRVIASTEARKTGDASNDIGKDAVIRDVSNVLKCARKVADFTSATFRVASSMIDASGYTVTETKRALAKQGFVTDNDDPKKNA